MSEFELTRWEKADNYFGEDLSDHFILLTKTRDSGPLRECNFEAAKERLDGYEGVRVDRFNHWGVGWVKQTLIKQGSEEALLEAEEIIAQLKNYPVLDDEDFRERRRDA